jgi:hypothetical protein
MMTKFLFADKRAVSQNSCLLTLLVLSDIPGLYENVRFIRTSSISFSRTFLRMSVFLAMCVILC